MLVGPCKDSTYNFRIIFNNKNNHKCLPSLCAYVSCIRKIFGQYKSMTSAFVLILSDTLYAEG